MKPTLRVEVPGPASCWTLTVDGIVHPVNESVPVAPGRRQVDLHCDLLWPAGQAQGHLTCTVRVPDGGRVRLTAPGAELAPLLFPQGDGQGDQSDQGPSGGPSRTGPWSRGALSA
ncbi:hypothetical protein ACIRSU_31865 [Streptomyces sp. NPDC101160]|uniref:hypothetical protein n=1 Tax=Streptomyces sp. NPDC101160 TaxID=3366118 RepID=UPI003829C077